MAKRTPPEKLSTAIGGILTYYGGTVAEGIKKAIEQTAQEMQKAIANDSPKLSGDYKKAQKLSTISETNSSITKQWFAQAPEYRKPHLLERSHKTRNGGKTNAIPHIEKNVTEAENKLIKRISEVIQDD